MFDHVSIQVQNLEKSKRFYQKAFEPLGYSLSFGEDGRFFAFDIGQGCLFELIQAQENHPISRTHIAFRVSTPEQVDAFYDAAIQAGGHSIGAPGPRPQYTPNYYACFVRDLDNHNIEAMLEVSEGVS